MTLPRLSGGRLRQNLMDFRRGEREVKLKLTSVVQPKLSLDARKKTSCPSFA